MTFNFSKSPGNPQTTLIQATFTNLSSNAFTDFVFQAAVPKVSQNDGPISIFLATSLLMCLYLCMTLSTLCIMKYVLFLTFSCNMETSINFKFNQCRMLESSGIFIGGLTVHFIDYVFFIVFIRPPKEVY